MSPQACSHSGPNGYCIVTAKWDGIHFNWGLHDLKHIKDGKPSNDPTDLPLCSVESYGANLEKIVARLKQTGAGLIFATTTPVASGTGNPFRSPDDPPRYNAAVVEVMKANGVRVNDLFAFIQPRLTEAQLPKNIHFTAAGSDVLAKEVADAIQAQLANRRKAR